MSIYDYHVDLENEYGNLEHWVVSFRRITARIQMELVTAQVELRSNPNEVEAQLAFVRMFTRQIARDGQVVEDWLDVPYELIGGVIEHHPNFRDQARGQEEEA